MPTGAFTGFFSSSQSGWTNSSNANANDGAYASANWSIIAGESNPTANLNLGFGRDLGGSSPIGISIDIKAHKSAANPGGFLSAGLTKSGASAGAEKSTTLLGTSDAVYTLGSASDLWSGAWTVDDVFNLGVYLYGTPSGANATASVLIDYVSMTITFEYPNSYSFAALTNQALSTTVVSDVATISGITLAAKAYVTGSGGEWRKNGGAWTAAAGTVVNGDTIQVRHTTSPSFNTSVSTNMFTGGIGSTFTSTTAAADTTPDAYDFSDVSGVDPGATATSNTVTVTGINTTASVSATNGANLIKNGSSLGSSSTTVVNNDTLAVQLAASGAFGGSASTTVSIGTGSDLWTVNTRAADLTPNAYAWTDLSGVPISTLQTSNLVTMAGMDAGQNATITFNTSGTAAGSYERNVNGAGWVAFTNGATATIQNGQTLQVRLTTSASAGATHNITTTIGGTADTFTVTNTTSDSTPDAFNFVDEPNALAGGVIQSNLVAIAGIDTTASGSFSTGGTGSSHQYSKNGGAWTALGAFTVVNGDTLRLRLTAPGTTGQTATITTTIGGVADAWTVTAQPADTVPNAFSFADVFSASFSTAYASNVITVSGINSPAAISVSGDASAQYSVNGGAFTSAPGAVSNGDTVQARLTSASSYVSAKDATVTIGGVVDTFTVTTRAQSPTSQYVAGFREARFGMRF